VLSGGDNASSQEGRLNRRHYDFDLVFSQNAASRTRPSKQLAASPPRKNMKKLGFSGKLIETSFGRQVQHCIAHLVRSLRRARDAPNTMSTSCQVSWKPSQSLYIKSLVALAAQKNKTGGISTIDDL